jgi:hypothetical protein
MSWTQEHWSDLVFLYTKEIHLYARVARYVRDERGSLMSRSSRMSWMPKASQRRATLHGQSTQPWLQRMAQDRNIVIRSIVKEADEPSDTNSHSTEIDSKVEDKGGKTVITEI